MTVNVINWLAGNKNAGLPSASDFAGASRRDINRALRDNKNNRILEEHERLRQKRREQQRNRRPRTGVVRLSNTDSIARAMEIRSRLMAKIQEITASEMDPRARDALIAEVQRMLDRVEQQIAAIRRRKRAIEEEQTRRRNESPEERRSREWHMKERRLYIRRDFLYHADKGGLNPNVPPFTGGFDVAGAGIVL